MKLIYIANARIPTEKAHGLQIMKMCESFSDAFNREVITRSQATDSNSANGQANDANKKVARKIIEVELVVPRRFNRVKDDPFEYYGLKNNFEITRLPCLDFLPLNSGKISFLLQIFSFLFFAKIYLLFKSYDVLYTRESFAGFFFKNFIFEAHSVPAKIRPLHKKLWRKAGKIIAVTGFMKKKLAENGISADKILVAHDAVDLEKFDIKISKEEARKKIGLPEDKILLGYIGMFRTQDMEKGIDIAIQSLRFLEDRVSLVLVGGHKEDIEFYKKMAEELSLASRVIFTGRKPHDLMPVYLKALDILLAPFPETEHYKFYMSPMKIFEYMASKRPIVASDLPSLREILNENNSVLVQPNDPASLGEGIKKILSDSSLAGKISVNSLDNVKKHTWLERATAILDFLGK